MVDLEKYEKFMRKKQVELEKEICTNHPYSDDCTCQDCNKLFNQVLFAGLDYLEEEDKKCQHS